MSALLLQFWPYIAAAGAALIGIWRLYATGKSAGIKAERAKQAAAETKARDVAGQVDNDIGALPADKARDELKGWHK